MRVLQLIIIFVAFVVFNSCSKDEPMTIETEDFGTRLQFDQLEVGQMSKYVFFIGENYDQQGTNSYTYVTDTMVLEVFDKDEIGFLVREYLTPGSASLHTASNVAFADATVVYYLQTDGNEIKLVSKEERLMTRLFQVSSTSDASYDLAELDMLEIKINGWTTSQPLYDGVLEGYTKNYRQLNLEFDDLNVLIDNRDVMLGGPGNTHVYSEKYGLVRATSYNASTGKGFGWDLLP